MQELSNVRPGTVNAGHARPVINFRMSSAKRRLQAKLQRSIDLMKLISLDAVHFNMFDMPPIGEYDLYIRSFGRRNSKQVSRTNEQYHIFCSVRSDSFIIRANINLPSSVLVLS